MTDVLHSSAHGLFRYKENVVIVKRRLSFCSLRSRRMSMRPWPASDLSRLTTEKRKLTVFATIATSLFSVALWIGLRLPEGFLSEREVSCKCLFTFSPSDGLSPVKLVRDYRSRAARAESPTKQMLVFWSSSVICADGGTISAEKWPFLTNYPLPHARESGCEASKVC